jgi:phytoene synthase
MNTINWGISKYINLDFAYGYCESIAKQKNPFLYYVSSFFKDKNKFKAFCSTYASMRILDDFVDGIKSRTKLSGDEKIFYLEEINKWENLITDCYNGMRFENPILRALSDTFKTFDIQLSPWANLAEAMRWDIEHSRFNTFKEFLNYTEGAAIAPATVFISVLSAKSDGEKYNCSANGNNSYYYAKDLAIFCYLTHILRDVSCDLELEDSGLIYLSVEDLNRFSISENDLWNFKSTKSINTKFQQLMEYQIRRARKFGNTGKAKMNRLFEYLDSDCRFILNLLVSLYEKTMDKIESVSYNVFNGKHELNNFEIFKTTVNNARINSIERLKILQLGFGLIKKSYPKFMHLHS